LRKIARSDWRGVVLVCGKCTRKVNGGFGPKGTTPLVKALRKWAGKGKGRKAGVGAFEVPCLKICPKHAVTVIDGANPGKWRIVAAGTPVADVAAELGLVGLGSGDAAE
jgi:predicted metal-binding protein